MMRIVYSFNKRGWEENLFRTAMAQASSDDVSFIPFNHDPYLDPYLYQRAQLLDDLYFAREERLLRMYRDLRSVLEREDADVLLVDNMFPYHPEFLRTLPVYKVLRTTDGPLAAYDRDFAYLHAYHHVLFHSPAYSPELTMQEKLRYCGATNADFWPLAVFDAAFDPAQTTESLMARPRDIDVVFVGVPHPNKMPLLAKVKRTFRRHAVIRGRTSVKRNLYNLARHRYPGWVSALAFEDYVPLYQRAKIGFNVHNRGDYTVGSYRLFELPANGVMQISDGGDYLSNFFEVDKEIVRYSNADELIDKIRHYLAHEEERIAIAAAGHLRVMRDHRIVKRMEELIGLIENGMQRIGWDRTSRTAERPAVVLEH